MRDTYTEQHGSSLSFQSSPDGLTISIVSFVDGLLQPLAYDAHNAAEDYMKPERYVNKTCGMFGEFAHPVKNLDASISFWENWDLKLFPNSVHPTLGVASDGLAVVGLHIKPIILNIRRLLILQKTCR